MEVMALPSYQEALASALGVVSPNHGSESVSLQNAIGRVLSNDIVADRNLPPYNRSKMDGYAVVASEVSRGVSLQVIGHVVAGTIFDGKHQQNTCGTIATGAPVPDGFDAVVPHEQTDKGEELVRFDLDEVNVGASIHRCGVDASAGDVLIPSRTVLKPHHVGIAASVGDGKIKVVPRPRVIIVSSGDEVVLPPNVPLQHQIRNSNSPMTNAVFTALGCDIVESHHIPDDPEATNATVERALDGRAEILVTIGGISAGDRDYFPAAFDHAGVSLVVTGARIQPGKPVMVGDHAHGIVLGLPGNPVSALACSCVFGWPIVLALLGVSPDLPWEQRALKHQVKPNPNRTAFRPCAIQDGAIVVPSWQGSGDLSHTASTDGLVQLPPSNCMVDANEEVPFLPWPWR